MATSLLSVKSESKKLKDLSESDLLVSLHSTKKYSLRFGVGIFINSLALHLRTILSPETLFSTTFCEVAILL